MTKSCDTCEHWTGNEQRHVSVDGEVLHKECGKGHGFTNGSAWCGDHALSAAAAAARDAEEIGADGAAPKKPRRKKAVEEPVE